MRKRRSMNLKSKTGNLFLDLMMVVLVLLGMAILGLVANNMLGDLNADIQADDDLGTLTKTTAQTLETGFPTWMDNAFLFATILLWVFIIVSSMVVDSHPAFFIISVILIIFALGMVMMLSNTFEEFAADSEYTGLNTDFPITYWIMDNLLILVIIMGASVLVTLYGKNKFIGG